MKTIASKRASGIAPWAAGVVRSSLFAGAALLAFTPAIANAAEDNSDGTEQKDETIVVTGTLVRGVAPTGASVIGVTAENVVASGVATTAQLLQTVPQLGSFNDLQFPTGFGNSVTANRPNLRNLPGFNTAGGSSTLVLLDGHRMVGVGITSTAPDPDVIPAGAIERLEIVPDGGSAMYGSDAVAGVMNFVTRKKFDGFQVGGRVGFADSYTQYTADATVGKDWGAGGIYLAYSFAKNDEIRGRDRDYVQSFPVASNGFLPLNCNPGNIQITSAGVTTNYGLPSRAAVANTCEISDSAIVYPSLERHSLMAGFAQDLSDSLSIDIKGYYTHRRQTVGLGEFHPGNSTLTATNPFFAANRIGTETSHVVTYSFGPATATDQPITLSTWGITPTLTWKFGGNWQLKVLGSYGESDTTSHQGAFNPTALSTAIATGLFNPYAPNTSNAQALSIITNYETYGHTRQFLGNFRAILDGDLFQFTGGAVKLALGAEYLSDHFKAQFGATVPGAQNLGAAAQLVGATTVAPATTGLPVFDLKRNVKSLFGELVVPFFGADNATPGFEELRLSLAGRYDKYSDFGGTFNPKVGLTWKPFDFVTLRGSWGKSFNAPSLADNSNADVLRLIVRTTAQFGPTAAQQAANGGPWPNVPAGAITYLRRGNAPGIQPQRAESWTLGADVSPVSGLKFGATYYNIFVKGLIGLPNTNPTIVFQDYANILTINPSTALLNNLVSTAGVFDGTPCHASATPCTVYAFVELSKNNQGDFKVQGLDLSTNISHPTDFGSLSLDVNANYELKRYQRATPTANWVDLLAANNSRFKIRTAAGAQVGNLFGQVVWNHSAGYKLNPAVGFVAQSKVDSFDVFNLFFRYEPKGEGLFKDLSFTLNVDNVFDRDPPVYRQFNASQYNIEGFINGNTLGRFIQVGVSKKF